MIKKLAFLLGLIMAGLMLMGASYASPPQSDIFIDKVSINSETLAEGKTNLIPREGSFRISTFVLSKRNINNVKVEAVITDSNGNSIAESTQRYNMHAKQYLETILTFNLGQFMNQNNLRLHVRLVRNQEVLDQAQFILTFGEFKADISSAQKPDAIIEAVRANNNILAESRENVLQSSNALAFSVEIFALEDIKNSRIQVILSDLKSGFTVSDMTSSFDLAKGQRATRNLAVSLSGISNSNFKLSVKLVSPDLSKEKLYFITFGNSQTTPTPAPTTPASTAFDVSINRVRVNGQVVAQSRNNIINDANSYSVAVDFTAVRALENARIEAVLRGRQSGVAVADTTNTFNLQAGASSSQALNLALIDGLRRDKDFDLTIRIIDARERSELKSYLLTTDFRRSGRISDIDVSIDRVVANSKVLAEYQANALDEADSFSLAVYFTALEELEDARIEAVLFDLMSGKAVADTTQNFDLLEGTSALRNLNLELIDGMKKSDAFKLEVRIIDAEGNHVQKNYGINTGDNGAANGALGMNLLIESVEVEDEKVIENENNLLFLSKSKRELDVEIKMTALSDIDNAKIEGTIYFANGDSVTDSTPLFDLNDNEKASKRLEILLAGRTDLDNLLLRLRITDEDGNIQVNDYWLKISSDNFPFLITSIEADDAEAGKNSNVKVNFRNLGFGNIEGVNVKVSIPEINAESTKFHKAKKGNAELSEEFLIKIPENAQAGTYNLIAEISSQFNGARDVKQIPIKVMEIRPMFDSREKLVVTVPVASQAISREAKYPLILENKGDKANAYTLAFDADWADLSLSDSNVVLLGAGEAKRVDLIVKPKENVRGQQKILVSVKSKENVLKQIQLNANVSSGKIPFFAQVKSFLYIMLVLIVVTFAAIAIYFGYKSGSESEEFSEEIPEREAGEAYY